MAFLIPLIELGEVLAESAVAFEAVEAGVGAVGAVEASEGVAAMDIAAAAEEAVPAAEDIAMVDEAGYVYDEGYSRLPIEEPDIGEGVMEGYPIEDVAPYEPFYWGDAGGVGYMPLASEEVAGTAYEPYALSYLRDDTMLRNAITVGAGKAIFVAGLWHFLDPITGAPIYAMSGDDPRVQSVMEALGYTDSAKEAGLVLRDWFKHLFGYDMPNSDAGRYTSRASGSLRPPKIYQGLSARENLTMSMARRPKRPRSDSTSYVVPVPRGPSMIVKARAKKARTQRITSLTRTLARFFTIEYQINSSGNVEFGINGKYSLNTSGSYAASDGYQWSNDAFAFLFRLNDFNEYTDITNSFDQYRIKSVSISYIPAYPDATIAEGKRVPVWIAAEDHDDILLTSLSYPEKLSSKQGSKMLRMGESIVNMKVKPQAWSSHTANVPKTKILGGWLPTVNSDVYHYGVKAAPIKQTLSNPPSGNPTATTLYSVTLMMKAVIECKHMD